MKNILKVEHLEKYYGNKGNITRAIDDISFDVAEGEYIGIMGASGSGKTTLLNCISTIDNLLDTLTGFENIALALTIMKVPAKEIGQRVQKVAELLNITDVLSKHPYQMSGGQRQRVASARAIVTNPSIILADEPTGALDSKSARMLLESFRKLNDEIQATILMVTHDAFTASYCKRILFIKDGKLFNELIRGMESRKEFFDRIMEVIALLGGDLNAE